MTRKRIYLDYAAATPVAAPVLAAMQPYFRKQFGNASSLHAEGTEAADVVLQSKKRIARLLGCNPNELIFTSGGTESINLAIKGCIGSRDKQQHIVSTTIEHASTFAVLSELKKNDHAITLVPCAQNGIVSSKDILAAVRSNTTLVSVILIQNEIGTIQPIPEIGRKLIAVNRERARRNLPPVLLHVDACQAPAWVKLNLPRLHADLISLDASKCYGPKGSGLLYIRKGLMLAPQLHGGGQQETVRSGTEPVALIEGLTAALEYTEVKRRQEMPRIQKLRDYLIDRVCTEIPGSMLTGDRYERVANSASFAFSGVEGESLVLRLDRAGIAASTGSACSIADPKPSPVLAAIRLPNKYKTGSLRLTMGYGITRREIDFCILQLKKIIAVLRK